MIVNAPMKYGNALNTFDLRSPREKSAGNYRSQTALGEINPFSKYQRYQERGNIHSSMKKVKSIPRKQEKTSSSTTRQILRNLVKDESPEEDEDGYNKSRISSIKGNAYPRTSSV